MNTQISGSDKIRVSLEGAVAQLTIHNPPANTWDLESLNALHNAVQHLNADPAIVALVISGQGEKFFSAGADLKQFSNGDKVSSLKVAEAFGKAFEALATFEGVTIAAINGYAMGGGLECALACDIRIMEQQAQLALPEAAVGLLPCAGGTQRLSWLVGEAWAARMILCGERVDATTAERIGLVQQSCPPGEALTTALALAQKTATQSPDAIRSCKRLLSGARERAITNGLEQERNEFVDLIGEKNQLEGTNAFLEKRPASWQ